MKKEIQQKLAYMPYAEMIFVSALTGQRLNKIFALIDSVVQFQCLRIQTGVLNEILTEDGYDITKDCQNFPKYYSELCRILHIIKRRR